ncbi:aminotransferase class I/II-fold pyridoxal phosphate-dependent enzyme [Streptomyces roseicoloratus]|uniref:Aminotransferase class I/II-fold pyridoxal phosphate-dependent enzyme n=1 Tax=Streptomyces roseicoloratus TaxID=2508722 RepID=A0ABY9S2G3_9ACTN|nr:aminotransferase class I/II-fold pyridoxal phosphate-dependent enzyme [Streptomyces roseicoloratus]WMX48214.1 aminotransferase class I/II-fold pyridoxal phosphate-dependent enzyme [Streptomyces roseicoloratus]
MSDIRDKRVLVTGGAGTIGSHVTDLLVEGGAREVVVLDNFVRGRRANLARALASGRVRLVEGDIRDAATVRRVTEGADLVYHLAAIRITQCAEEPRLANEVMVDGTFNVLEAAAAAGVGKVIASSSASVYGLAESFPTDERHHPYNNDTFYGAAKAFNEGMLRSFHAMYGLDYVALRYFNVYGPRMDIHGLYTEVLIRWMERIAAGEPPLILGDGTQTMDFVDVRDIARANILAARADLTDEVFNVASSTETSLRELADALLEVMGSNLEPVHGPARAVNGVTRRLADTTRAEERLGFKAEIDLRTGLRDLVDWWRAEKGATATDAERAASASTGGSGGRTAGAPARIPVMVPWLGEAEATAAAEAVRSGWVAQGPRVDAFEQAFAERVGARYGVAVSSCTTALHLALVALGAGPGDEVVVPSLSFIATANAVRYVGAEPVFADVDPATGNLTPDTVDAVRTARTKAVLVVHQAGVPADVTALRAACEGWGLPLVEDAACAIGSTVDGGSVGRGALLAAWSFHPRKLLTTGEGGMVTTDDAEWAARLRRLREHGMNVSAAERHASGTPVLESYLETGFNYRMTDIQAAVGLAQLEKLDALVARRRELAARYGGLLVDVPGLEPVRDPSYGQGNFQSYWVLLAEDHPVGRDALLAILAEAGVSARRGIMASHLEPAYAGHPAAPLPVTERISRDSLILPLFHTMTEEQQDRVVAVLREATVRP